MTLAFLSFVAVRVWRVDWTVNGPAVLRLFAWYIVILTGIAVVLRADTYSGRGSAPSSRGKCWGAVLRLTAWLTLCPGPPGLASPTAYSSFNWRRPLLQVLQSPCAWWRSHPGCGYRESCWASGRALSSRSSHLSWRGCESREQLLMVLGLALRGPSLHEPDSWSRWCRSLHRRMKSPGTIACGLSLSDSLLVGSAVLWRGLGSGPTPTRTPRSGTCRISRKWLADLDRRATGNEDDVAYVSSLPVLIGIISRGVEELDGRPQAILFVVILTSVLLWTFSRRMRDELTPQHRFLREQPDSRLATTSSRPSCRSGHPWHI